MEKGQKDMIGEIIKAFEKYAEHQALINNREDKIIGIIAEDRL